MLFIPSPKSTFQFIAGGEHGIDTWTMRKLKHYQMKNLVTTKLLDVENKICLL